MAGGGDGLGRKGIPYRRPRGRAPSFQVRSHPSVTFAASRSAYLAVLGVQVWEAGTWGDIEHRRRALVTRHRGRALGPSDQVE